MPVYACPFQMTSVVLETSLGEITFELYWDHAPKVHTLVLLEYGPSLLIEMYRHARTLLSLPNADTIMA